MSGLAASHDAADLLRRATAFELWRLGAVRVSVQEPFHLASGALSPLYVNGRQVIGDPAFVRLFVAAAGAVLAAAEVRHDVVAGGETAGIPYAAFLAQAFGMPMAYLRKKPKGYGMGQRVEGALLEGRRVLLVEDLITDGGSKLAFLDAIAEGGGTVEDALVFFDRQQGGQRALSARGVRLHAITDLQTTLDCGVAAGALSADERRTVDRYLESPQDWQPA